VASRVVGGGGPPGAPGGGGGGGGGGHSRDETRTYQGGVVRSCGQAGWLQTQTDTFKWLCCRPVTNLMVASFEGRGLLDPWPAPRARVGSGCSPRTALGHPAMHGGHLARLFPRSLASSLASLASRPRCCGWHTYGRPSRQAKSSFSVIRARNKRQEVVEHAGINGRGVSNTLRWTAIFPNFCVTPIK